MAARHHRKAGGSVDSMSAPKEFQKSADVVKDVEGKKRGGGVKKHEGHMAEGHAAKKRMDRPGRKRGGRCGADMSPLSSAGKTSKSSGTVSSEIGD